MSNLETNTTLAVSGVYHYEYKPGYAIFTLIPRPLRYCRNSEMDYTMYVYVLLLHSGIGPIMTMSERKGFV